MVKDSPEVVETDDVPVVTQAQRRRGHFFDKDDSSNENLEDITSPPSNENERRSFIPLMLGDSVRADRLTEAYEDLNTSKMQEMEDDFDDNLEDRELLKMKKTPQRLPKTASVLKSIKKPLQIQVIEEAEFEESVNPYGHGISPGAMAGDNFKFHNELSTGQQKIFNNKLQQKAQQIMTPTNTSGDYFEFSKQGEQPPLQTP